MFPREKVTTGGLVVIMTATQAINTCVQATQSVWWQGYHIVIKLTTRKSYNDKYATSTVQNPIIWLSINYFSEEY